MRKEEERINMKKLFEIADQYVRESDWKDLAMIKSYMKRNFQVCEAVTNYLRNEHGLGGGRY